MTAPTTPEEALEACVRLGLVRAMPDHLFGTASGSHFYHFPRLTRRVNNPAVDTLVRVAVGEYLREHQHRFSCAWTGDDHQAYILSMGDQGVSSPHEGLGLFLAAQNAGVFPHKETKK